MHGHKKYMVLNVCLLCLICTSGVMICYYIMAKACRLETINTCSFFFKILMHIIHSLIKIGTINISKSYQHFMHMIKFCDTMKNSYSLIKIFFVHFSI